MCLPVSRSPFWPIQSLAQNILRKRETKSFKFRKREEVYFDLSLPQKYSVLEVEFGEWSKQSDWGWGDGGGGGYTNGGTNILPVVNTYF